ncbi:MAG: endonuclease/exonuclease/phosphatase family protein [Winogradskyella sp.]|uniref:endonuclease/exonuclease/phosphatase family protein n=1 Tax=Winogradskyella sp. TaxID=1883156 RepID=UPI0017F314BF|nr:endonuclease/exonuclease/phosphatase family protein [Winogradskyella sp.]
MKRLSFLNKIIFVVNSLAAFLLLLSYILPFVPPRKFALLSVVSLGVPFLILINILFLVYWLLRVKKQLMLSLVVLLLGYNYLGALYKFSSSKKIEDSDNISVMSFNVRLFNRFEWLPSKTVREDIINFINEEQPDILCLQEYTRGLPIKLEGYNDFNARYNRNAKGGQSIFSKYPIVNYGSLEFTDTKNNVIYADIARGNDTIRVYNMHLQSLGIIPDVDTFKKESSESLINRTASTFRAQQDQVEKFLEHKANCPYKVIVAGDFNNTAYSYTYNAIKGDLIDTFEEGGNGFGRTYDFKFFPVRIDFILVDEAFTTNGFNAYDDIILSDHYPIKATLKLH